MTDANAEDLFDERRLAAVAQRDAGMKQAVDHAEEVQPGWKYRAFAFLRAFAETHDSFISEDVSDAAIAAGEPQPPTLRAWGAIYVRAIREDIIIQTGSGRSRRRHNSICPRWGSLVFKGDRA